MAEGHEEKGGSRMGGVEGKMECRTHYTLVLVQVFNSHKYMKLSSTP